jgi:hypothetical protein
MYPLTGLDAGFLVGRDEVIVVTERLAVEGAVRTGPARDRP